MMGLQGTTTRLQKQSRTRRFSNINNKSSLHSRKKSWLTKNQWAFLAFLTNSGMVKILDPTKSKNFFTQPAFPTARNRATAFGCFSLALTKAST